VAEQQVDGAAARERQALVASMAVAFALAVLGVVVGLLTASQMILFDGIYSFLGIALTLLALRVSHVVEEGPTPRYPFGRESLTPLVIGVQGMALLVTCVYGAVDAVLTILDGGSQVALGWAVAYGLVSFFVPIAFWWWLRRAAPGSELVGAEAAQWKVGGLLGLGLLGGFSVVLVLQGTSKEGWADYVDPVMVLVSCVVLLPTPLRMLRVTLWELLERVPPSPVREPVKAAVEEVRAEFGLGAPYLRLNKVGRKLYVEADFLVDPSMTVGEADAVRRAIRDRLQQLPYELWLNVELSADETLVA
jgi:cation diffusion facilitator family transporter